MKQKWTSVHTNTCKWFSLYVLWSNDDTYHMGKELKCKSFINLLSPFHAIGAHVWFWRNKKFKIYHFCTVEFGIHGKQLAHSCYHWWFHGSHIFGTSTLELFLYSIWMDAILPSSFRFLYHFDTKITGQRHWISLYLLHMVEFFNSCNEVLLV